MIKIGLTTNRDVKNGSDCMPKDYVLSILRAGALPMILPMIPEDAPNYRELLEAALSAVDGLVFTGGPDIDPTYYQEEILPGCHTPVSERDKVDLTLMKMALDSGKPFLGICRGLQVCNVALGGSLYQDLPSQVPGVSQHQVPETLQAHTVELQADSLLEQVSGKGALPVTSRHHQAIKDLGKGLVVSARSAVDGVIEAVEFADGRPALCLQWHPENLSAQDSRHQALFDWLVEMARKTR